MPSVAVYRIVSRASCFAVCAHVPKQSGKGIVTVYESGKLKYICYFRILVESEYLIDDGELITGYLTSDIIMYNCTRCPINHRTP